MEMHTPNIEDNTFGIYLHIPFCKQACHYCDFHFSTSLKKKGDLLDSLCAELILRKNEILGKVATIYLGGGTPSLLTAEELQQLLETIYSHYTIAGNPEITLEANPDDLFTPLQPENISEENKFKIFRSLGINRLSIGVQSFYEEDLILMNRAHNAAEALNCIIEARKYFENISIDLIYGIPGMSEERWRSNLETALALNVPHLSCYALTVEPKTALKKFIDTGAIPPVDEQAARHHYEILVKETQEAGFDNYEFSNFGKTGFESRNNTAYWEGRSYLGIGPSAHSYNGKSRSWNIANNTLYIKNIQKGNLPMESENLSVEDKYNEYVMTGLRTKKGVSLEKISSEFGYGFLDYLMEQAVKPLKRGQLILEGRYLKISKEAKFLGDGIASELFMV